MTANKNWKTQVRKAVTKIRSGESTGIDITKKIERIDIRRENEKTISKFSKKRIKPKPLFPFRLGGYALYNYSDRPSKAIVEYYGPNNPRNVKRNFMRKARQQAEKKKNL